jgi:carbonic anhydrase
VVNQTQVAVAAVVACIDPRIQKLLNQFRKKHGLNECNSTPHHIPGPSLNIEDELSRLDIAVNKLGATVIHVLDHASPQCKGFVHVFGDDYDPEHHKEHLKLARVLLTARFTEVEIHTYLMRLPDEIVEVT